ncbi:MAG: universal stress protein [Labilithrix sp.]|nr:universal stress protein [Labilithrix sp.]
MATFKHILVATDFEETSERALDKALQLAEDLDASVTIVHVLQAPPVYYSAYAQGLAWPVDELDGAARRALDAALAVAQKRHPKVDALLLVGAPRERILEAAAERKADLIVMGTHGRGGLVRAVLGSVAESVVRASPIPVLTLSA